MEGFDIRSWANHNAPVATAEHIDSYESEDCYGVVPIPLFHVSQYAHGVIFIYLQSRAKGLLIKALGWSVRMQRSTELVLCTKGLYMLEWRQWGCKTMGAAILFPKILRKLQCIWRSNKKQNDCPMPPLQYVQASTLLVKSPEKASDHCMKALRKILGWL